MDDKALRQAVIDELDFEPSIDAAEIGVMAERGVITLTGHVRSYTEKLTAEEVAKRVKGVKGLAMEIEIRHPTARKTADDEIARRAVDLLDWNVSIPSERIQVEVEHGWLTLTGDVDWHYQKQMAENAVRQLADIAGVTNLIAIRPTTASADVKVEIDNALKRNGELRADDIRVSVENGRVTLEGEVKAPSDRGIAERIAWAVRGGDEVDDRLKVA